MPPSATSSSQQAEVAFFDKVKKYLSNKQTFAEFLKLCNLFSQDLIDRNVLVHKVNNFIGTNLELMDFFKKFVGYTGPEEVIENRPRAPTGRVALSNCRGLGPSYRLLPKRVRVFNLLFPIVRFSCMSLAYSGLWSQLCVTNIKMCSFRMDFGKSEDGELSENELLGESVPLYKRASVGPNVVYRDGDSWRLNKVPFPAGDCDAMAAFNPPVFQNYLLPPTSLV
jgi:Paired amphipathic helix repeat